LAASQKLINFILTMCNNLFGASAYKVDISFFGPNMATKADMFDNVKNSWDSFDCNKDEYLLVDHFAFTTFRKRNELY